ncbi:cytochrome-c oxidase, cbb3-type subunit II [Methyloradius palustris]|uniref:Cytochrome c oxidase, cbb3-type subunit II n=1 Tax=Methyloradius palustris TaxID=2778876 RepID=A0A8D5G2D0_9PROT|nr:cytochrome c oxidase, cbb3-type subunit II [Methyloradius palustris]
MKLKHDNIERNLGLLLILTMLAISAGGLVEIVPLFFIKETVEKVEGVRPYSPLELRGRDIYVREGCYLCHSQMIRPFRDEALRYGHYSLAAESKYDHPFQWGSKRTGPDLARVGGKYSNEWHAQHLTAPRSLVPQSIMPNYPWLGKNNLDYSDITLRMKALRTTGVPYSESKAEYEQNVKEFGEDVAKTLVIADAEKNLVTQAQLGNYDSNAGNVSELDAVIAYLQVLGTMVDFKKYDDDYFVKFR